MIYLVSLIVTMKIIAFVKLLPFFVSFSDSNLQTKHFEGFIFYLKLILHLCLYLLKKKYNRLKSYQDFWGTVCIKMGANLDQFTIPR